MSLCETALQVRGEALTEEEIWSLLSLAVEQLLEDICDGRKESCGRKLLCAAGQKPECPSTQLLQPPCQQHSSSRDTSGSPGRSETQFQFRFLCGSGKLTTHNSFSKGLPAKKGKGKEFFFLDNETRLCKIALESWCEQPQKKTSLNTFTLFLKINFFVSHHGLLQNSQTRHQFYLILEKKLYCNDETLLQLGVLALKA
ncbi:FERM and PDZ domain-containing protein 2 [Manis javanica]|nr:FERM and PDZ domain-containing protein 2 [Manis javanica]